MPLGAGIALQDQEYIFVYNLFVNYTVKSASVLENKTVLKL